MEKISRSEARIRGLTHFFTGEKCNRAGHVAERFTSNGACVECRGLPKVAVAPPQPVEEAPEAQRRDSLWRDYGRRISQARIDACIDRIFGAAKLPESAAA
jgi:hypothetical protein